MSNTPLNSGQDSDTTDTGEPTNTPAAKRPTTMTIALDDHTLELIDKHAEASHMSRSGYVLQWLPDAHTLRSKHAATKTEAA